MGYTVWLLTLLLVAAVKSQSTTSTTESRHEEETSTETKGAASAEAKSNELDDAVTTAKAETETDPMTAAESVASFKFTEADAKKPKEEKPEKEEGGKQEVEEEEKEDEEEEGKKQDKEEEGKKQDEEGKQDEDEEDSKKQDETETSTSTTTKDLIQDINLVETILKDSEAILNDKSLKPYTEEDNSSSGEDSSSSGEDDDSQNTSEDDRGDLHSDDSEDDDNDDIESNDPVLVADSELQFRRQGDLNPYYLTPNERPAIDYTYENSPVLRLTQGGYARPYGLPEEFDDSQRLRSGSASQQSPIVETVNNQSPEQPRMIPQTPYSGAYTPQLNFGQDATLHQPFGPGGFIPSSGALPQNGFFNPSANEFTQYSAPNFQSQFSAVDDGGFSGFHREQNGNPLFGGPQRYPMNQELLYQGASQFAQGNEPSGTMQTLYHSGITHTFDNVGDASKPDYYAYFRNPAAPNAQLQSRANVFAMPPNNLRDAYGNPAINLLPGYPNAANQPQFDPNFIRYQTPEGQITPLQSANQQNTKPGENSGASADEQTPKETDESKGSTNKENLSSVPFGTRVPGQSEQSKNVYPEQGNLYIRYPMREAGYAIEDSLPTENGTENSTKEEDASPRPVYPFFKTPNQLRGFSNPDPYRNALNAAQRGFAGNDRSNDSQVNPRDPFVRNLPFPFDQRQMIQSNPVLATPFYPGPVANPFYQGPSYPGNRNRFGPQGPVLATEESNQTPTCALKNNASLCFEDEEYPTRELMYALTSNPFLLDRLMASTTQQLDEVALVELDSSESSESEDNYICKSDIKSGLPKRGKNLAGKWKVIVNMEEATRTGGKIKQPVRLEVCRSPKDPCSFTTQVKTACVQKFSLQRLLSWSPEVGVHTDVYKFPVACSCQIINKEEP